MICIVQQLLSVVLHVTEMLTFQRRPCIMEYESICWPNIGEAIGGSCNCDATLLEQLVVLDRNTIKQMDCNMHTDIRICMCLCPCTAQNSI